MCQCDAAKRPCSRDVEEGGGGCRGIREPELPRLAIGLKLRISSADGHTISKESGDRQQIRESFPVALIVPTETGEISVLAQSTH